MPSSQPPQAPTTPAEAASRGVCFSAAVRFEAPEPGANGSAPKRRKFSGVAYGGGVIRDHGWWEAVAFDLASLTAATPMPSLLQHDQELTVGVITTVTNDGRSLSVAGDLFADIDEDAAAIAAKSDAGLPYQMSVTIYPEIIEQLQPGASMQLNGQTVTGPLAIFRGARVREVSFCALGADSSTRATVFTAAPAPSNPSAGNSSMTTTTTTAPASDLATVTAERDRFAAELATAKTALEALQAQVEASRSAAREVEVKAMLGESFSADAAKPFMNMDDAQFAAVRALRPAAGVPASFTVERATEGAAPNALADSPLLRSARAMFSIPG